MTLRSPPGSTRARRLRLLLEASWTAESPEQVAAAREALDGFYAEEKSRLQAEERRRARWAEARGGALALAAAALFTAGALAVFRGAGPGEVEHGWLAPQSGSWQASLGLQGPDIPQQVLRAGQTVVLPSGEGPLRVDVAVQSLGEPPPTLYAVAFFLHSDRATLVYRGAIPAGARFDPSPQQVPLAREPGELVFLVVAEPLPEEVMRQPEPAAVLALLTGDAPKWAARVLVEAP